MGQLALVSLTLYYFHFAVVVTITRQFVVSTDTHMAVTFNSEFRVCRCESEVVFTDNRDVYFLFVTLNSHGNNNNNNNDDDNNIHSVS